MASNYVLALTLVSCVVGALLLKWLLTTFFFNQYDLNKIPSPPASFIYGHLSGLLQPNFHRLLSKWTLDYGLIYRVRIFGLSGIVVADPLEIARILGQERGLRELPKAARTYQVLDRLWGKQGAHSIFTDLNTDMWKVVRKSLSPAFSTANIRGKFPIARSKAIRLAEAIATWGSKCPVDIDDAGMRYTLDVVGLAGFGHDFNSVNLGENRVISSLPPALEMCQQQMTNPFAMYSFSKERRLGLNCVEEFQGIIAELLAELKSKGPFHENDSSIGGLLLRIIDPVTGKPLCDAQLKAEIGTMIMGGFETTAHTLAFTLFCIATHPEVEATILAELQSLGLAAKQGAPQARPLEYDDLRNMPYITNVIKEAMRMFPVVAGFPREVQQDCTIGNYRVPKGIFVYVLFHALHNHPSLWRDHDTFSPERWNDQGAGFLRTSPANTDDSGMQSSADQLQTAPKTFLPFSDGPRNCIGQAMAMMELRTAIATLCSHFSLELAPEMGGKEGVVASEVMALTLHARNGIRMFCHPRKV